MTVLSQQFKYWQIAVFALSFAVLSSAAAQNDSKNTEKLIKKLISQHLEANEKESIKDVLATLHPESTVREQVRQTLPPIFEACDCCFEMRDFRYIGVNGDLASASFNQVTRKVKGTPQFRDNTIQMVGVFKKSGDKWLIFAFLILKVDYSVPPIEKAEEKEETEEDSGEF